MIWQGSGGVRSGCRAGHESITVERNERVNLTVARLCRSLAAPTTRASYKSASGVKVASEEVRIFSSRTLRRM